MTRNDVLNLVRGYMLLDDQPEPRSSFGRTRPMVVDFMIQTIDLNCPQWRKIVGLEDEVHDLILKAMKKHPNIKFE